MTGEYLYHHKEALLRFWVHVASQRVNIMTLEYMYQRQEALLSPLSTCIITRWLHSSSRIHALAQ